MPAPTFELRREWLNNVDDVAERWQIEGGTMFLMSRPRIAVSGGSSSSATARTSHFRGRRRRARRQLS